ncbi:hydroxymethylbilane synthase [Buchnera aphidicola]|uniref:Porphobilinogen deaminase n=1 Tax=Buchnera aphidicola (Aphis gossypii) TaxID=98785 RepID=A0A5J6ZB01_9GAMM|nr:hydroxymethylbilane synthase [Buchnera aphidicola]QFQ31848.1 hydroxymethylbilane synthase [Buchnera aphidicola (Aphis gossypii)]UPT14381.1 hydroxymethylbilane synthase [Buchnera aphidicola (Aphis gossypii)]
MKKKILRIATRKSPLALEQTKYVKKKILSLYPDLNIKLVPIVTHGDNILNKSLSKIGGKGLFIKELEFALLENRADIAIHSMKDLPVHITKELCLVGICQRGNPLDSLVSNHYKSINQLPKGAIIGTSSLRRQCQLITYRPDLIVSPLRGNIETRIAKLDQGQYDAIILATEGLNRLHLNHRITQIIPAELSLPSCGQGAIGIQSRLHDKKILFFLSRLNHINTFIEISAERAFCQNLEAGCQIPIGSYAILRQNKIWLRGLIGSPDGTIVLKGERFGWYDTAKEMAFSLANELLSNGAQKILDNIYTQN